MSCADWRVEISALLDGQLDPRAEERLQDHLDGCSECTAFLADMKASEEVFIQARKWGLTPPEHLWIRLAARLRPAAADPVHWTSGLIAWLSPRYGYATALAMLLISMLFVAERQENLARQSLAALDAYQLEVEGNPFFVQPSSPAAAGVNPFQKE